MTALRKMAAALVLAAMALQPCVAGDHGRAAVRKQVESSLLVAGNVVINPDGSVRSHELDPKAALSPTLVRFVGDAVGKWRFEPIEVDGQAVTAQVPMHLRLVAKQSDDGKFKVSIVSTHFGKRTDVAGAPKTSDQLNGTKLTPPQYPKAALHMGGKGTVYVVVQVGRDGNVLNADAEQVNLRVLGTENQMAMLRKILADAALRTAKRWTFSIPTTGEEATRETWLARVPVDFLLHGDKPAQDGEWQSYVPGPRNIEMPWAREKLRLAGSPEALPEGGVYPLEGGARLLTPVDG